MDRVDPLLFRNSDDGADVQIRLDRLPTLGRADEIRLIRLEAVERKTVFITVDRDRLQRKLGGRPKYAYGNFPPVRNKQFPHEKSSKVATLRLNKNRKHCVDEGAFFKRSNAGLAFGKRFADFKHDLPTPIDQIRTAPHITLPP